MGGGGYRRDIYIQVMALRHGMLFETDVMQDLDPSIHDTFIAIAYIADLVCAAIAECHHGVLDKGCLTGILKI